MIAYSKGGILITEMDGGRLLHVQTDSSNEVDNLIPGNNSLSERKNQNLSQVKSITNIDSSLRKIIKIKNLNSFPGMHLKEENSQLSKLGAELFFDPILSGDKSLSCATCHHPIFSMTDGRVLPI